MSLPPAYLIDVKQVTGLLSRGLLAFALTTALGSCGGPSTSAETTAPATLPTTAAGRDSVKDALSTPAADAAGTGMPTVDTAATKLPASKAPEKPRSALPKASE